MLVSVLASALFAAPLVVAVLEYRLTHRTEIKRGRKYEKALKQMMQANRILEESHLAKQTRHYTEHDDWDEDYRRILRPKTVTGAVIRTGTGIELSAKGFRPEPWSQTPPDRLEAALRWHREMEINPVMASINYLGWNSEQCSGKTTHDLVSAVEAQLRKDGGFD